MSFENAAEFNANRSGPIVGIDLGTTNSVVAAVVQGKPTVLDDDGEKILPSVVGFNMQGKLITGVVARNQLAAFPDRTIASIKRRMGTMDPVQLGDQSFTPPEISAMILRRLRDRASRVLGQPVTRAVITVPAFFDDNQRQATREAGELAGFTVERIINEPTAATLVYHAGEHDPRRIVVYDFGGGTFDVSIVRMEAGVVEVLTSKGDTRLGGDDLDQALLDQLADQFLEEHQIDLRQNAGTRFRLLHACERAKCRLSTEETVQIMEEFIAEQNGQPLHLNVTISRTEFERLIEPFVERTIASVDEALLDAGLTVHQIDDLVLVGGSTRIPMVEQRLRDEFLREPSRAVDPDLAVALGAAVQAAMIDGQSVGPVLVDVTPHTLGLEVCDVITIAGPHMVFSPIIHRNSPLPARYEHAYSTLHEDQEMAEIHVLQGEHSDVNRNRSIGKFMLNLKTGSGARSKIVVRFDLTLDGTLDVTASQPATGISKKLSIDNALSQFHAGERDRAATRLGKIFADYDAGASGSDAADFHDSDDDRNFPRQWASDAARLYDDGEEQDHAGDYEAKFPRAIALIQKAEKVKSSVASQDAEDMASLSVRLLEAMATNDEVAVATLSEELDDILFYVE